MLASSRIQTLHFRMPTELWDRPWGPLGRTRDLDHGLGPSRRHCSDCRARRQPGSLAFVSKAMFLQAPASTAETTSTLFGQQCHQRSRRTEYPHAAIMLAFAKAA
ncbi:unnamed protein product [Symbiodinium sp. CCMP2592]|nr:unnamed protein product [Symbiodinium sp. CCMP2592]